MNNQHLTKDFLNQFKTDEPIQLYCEYCNKAFMRNKKAVMVSLKHNVLMYCSNECSHATKKTGKIISCEVCGKEVYKQASDIGEHNYCSKTCSNKNKTHSEQTKEILRQKALSWIEKLKLETPFKYAEYIENLRIKGIAQGKKQAERMKAKSKLKSWDELGKDGKRTRVIDEQKNCCNCCGLSHWRNETLTLEIEHKDGNHMNDSRDNLEALCPNCHSLTHTWRGKNKNTKGNVSDEVLLDALSKTTTIRQALIAVGLSPRGKNYVRAKRLLATLTK